MNDEYVMYLIVRTDLKMSKGKIAAQCGHAVQWLVINGLQNKSFKEYLKGCYAKICLKIPSETEMDKISGYCYHKRINHYQVIDAGRTQVPVNSKTVLGVGPLRRSQVPDLIRDLKLL